MSSNPIKSLAPDLQIGFYYRLKSIKDLYFHDALSKTVKSLNVIDIDSELNHLVPPEALNKLAEFSLRGEALFPIPLLLFTNPFLLGYYRLLLGFSQKEFYSKGPYGIFKAMEEKGKLSSFCLAKITDLCESLIETSASLILQLDELSISSLTELQLLTVGPQLRGSKNNEYGQIATQKTFVIIKELLKDFIILSKPNSIEIKNSSNRVVVIRFSSDPDIEIIEKMPSGDRGLISIEIKGGKDISNVHNRIGEAEKSHQKAKQRGYFEFMTIISVNIDYQFLISESPTTSHFFHLDKITDIDDKEHKRFVELLSSIVGVNINLS